MKHRHGCSSSVVVGAALDVLEGLPAWDLPANPNFSSIHRRSAEMAQRLRPPDPVRCPPDRAGYVFR